MAVVRKEHATAPMWRVEDNFQELLLSFYLVGIELRSLDLTSKLLYHLSHLADPAAILIGW